MNRSGIFLNDLDLGYKDKSNWWETDELDKGRMIDLNEDYPEQYFEKDHVSPEVVKNYCDCVAEEYKNFTGSELKSIVEFGCGGGWFAKEFYDRGYNIFGYEGSGSGIRKCAMRRFLNVSQKDFRNRIAANSKYQIALCTEVAGHIEPPFSSMLVHNLVTHADIIWWSSEVPGQNRPHLHHPNEQPYEYWINIFDFYNFGEKRLSDEIFNKCETRGRYLFYNRNVYK